MLKIANHKSRTNKPEQKWDAFSALLFGLVFCDSLITYFGTRLGSVRPALIILVLFLIFLVFRKLRTVLPSNEVLGWLALMMFGFVVGVVTAPDIGSERFPQIFSATIAFIIGYYFFKVNTDQDKLFWFFTVLSVLYVAVCVLAILRVAPHIFPIEVSLWAHGYSLNERPAITTDQNFQFFYIFIPILLIMFPTSLIRTICVLVLLAGSAFILVRIQTRSGVLVFMGGVLMALAYPYFAKNKERKKVIILSSIGALGVVAALPMIFQELGPLLIRFFSEGQEKETSAARLTSALYIFDIVWNPLYWIPQGNPTSLEGANKPHSNVAAVFLEAGMLGLIGWFMLFVKPIFKLSKEYLRKNSDRISSVVFVSGVMVLILQLSLNVPVMDQVWLWAGAVIGALEKKSNKEQAIDEISEVVVAKPASSSGVTLK